MLPTRRARQVRSRDARGSSQREDGGGSAAGDRSDLRRFPSRSSSETPMTSRSPRSSDAVVTATGDKLPHASDAGTTRYRDRFAPAVVADFFRRGVAGL